MKTFLILVSALSSPWAIACPDLSGTYKHTKYPWNGTMTVAQTECSTVTIAFSRPDSDTFTEELKTDGQAYKWIEESKELADENSASYNVTSYDETRLILRQFDGSKKDCGNAYAFNSAKCHLVEYSIGLNPATREYEWRQIGNVWSEGGDFSDQSFPLEKTN